MPHIIGSPCIDVMDTACVDVCPVDCIHSKEGQKQLYIDPVACIDCGACIAACPVAAIWPEEQLPADQKKFIQINKDFFSGFDKADSVVYKKGKKKDESGESKREAAEKAADEADSMPSGTVWNEVANWEEAWEARKDDYVDPMEVQKRYGRVRSVIEQNGRYTIRFFLPKMTPNHPFKYRYGLPEKMSTYDVTAEMRGNTALVQAKIADSGIAKLCGSANSFPDRFYAEYTFPKQVSSISIKKLGDHIVDVVAQKEAK